MYLLRAKVVVIVALLGLAAVAWLFTDLEMVGMDAGPGTDPGAFGFYTATWMLMMAAMMFPSRFDARILHLAHSARRCNGSPSAPTD